MPEQLSKNDLCLLLRMSDLKVASETARLESFSAESSSLKAFVERLIAEKLLTKWQFMELVNSRSQFRIGKYELRKLLEVRQPWTIYLADQLEMARRVIIQELTLDSPDTSQRFRENASKLAALNHPNVAHIYDFDEHQDRCFLILEERKGRTLKRLLADGMRSSEAASYLMQLAEGLSYLHRESIVHGNLRRSNVYIDAGRVCIWQAGESLLLDSLLLDNGDKSVAANDFEKEVIRFGKIVGEVSEKIEQGAAAAKLRRLAKKLIKSDDRAELLQQFPTDVAPLIQKNIVSTVQATVPESKNEPPRTSRWPRFAVPSVVVAIIAVLIASYIYKTSVGQSSSQKVAVGKKATPGRKKGSEENEPFSGRPAFSLEDAGLNSGDVNDPSKLSANSDPAETEDDHSPNEPDSSNSTDGNEEKATPENDVASTETTEPESSTPDEGEDPPNVDSTADAGSTVDGDSESISAESIDPFEELQTTFHLPIAKRRDDTKHVIGELTKGVADDRMLAFLDGGDIAFPGKIEFQIERANSRLWQFHMVRLGSRKPEVIGRLLVRDRQILFQWESTMASPAIANHLRNCLLRFEIEEHKHFLRLRDEPTEVEPITLSCRAPIFRKNLDVAYLPKLAALRVELVELSGDVPEFDGELPRSESAKTPLTLKIGQKKSKPLQFQVELAVKRKRPVLTIRPFYQLPGTTNWEELTTSAFLATQRQILAAVDSKPELKEHYSRIVDQLKKNGASESRISAAKEERKAREKRIDRANDDLKVLDNLCTTLDQRAQMRLRIFFEVSEQQIDLLVSKPFAASDP